MPSHYSTLLKDISDLDEKEKERLASLYLHYYDASDAARFVADLNGKTGILQLFFAGELVGFTTFELYEREWRGERVRVIFSGDTIVEQEHWGQQALALGWIGYIGSLKRERPEMPIYWFLIVKGHRTYKFLPAFTRSFYPHWEEEASELKPFLDLLAQEKFGEAYDSRRGIIAFEHSQGHLKPCYAHPSDLERSRPSTAFFLERNPGYARGEELACLCRFDDANLRPYTLRILNKREGASVR